MRPTTLRVPIRTVAFVAGAAMLAAGCRSLPWLDDAAHEDDPTPVSDPTVAARVEVTSGGWRLESYETDRGPCVDVVGPDGARQPRCRSGSPLENPDARHWMVVDGIDSAMRLPDVPIEWIATGLVRSEVAAVQLVLEGRGPQEVGLERIGDDTGAFLVALPDGVTRFELIAYDRDGCLLQHDRHDLEPPADGRATAPVEVVREPDCSRRLGTPNAHEAAAPQHCSPQLANAAPSGDGLDLYVPCPDQLDPRVVYRYDTGRPLSGDSAVDAREGLQLLLGDRADRRWFDPPGIEVLAVGLMQDGTLVVDLGFPATTGVGHLNTSHASALWHAALKGTLLQFSDVTRLELRADGSCQRYARLFEGDGCWRFGKDEAPWASMP